MISAIRPGRALAQRQLRSSLARYVDGVEASMEAGEVKKGGRAGGREGKMETGGGGREGGLRHRTAGRRVRSG